MSSNSVSSFFCEILELTTNIKLIEAILMPLALSPMLLNATKEVRCAYVLVIMALFWVNRTLPVAMTALIPIIGFPLLSVMSASEISTSYFNDSIMLFFGSAILAIAIRESRLNERIVLKILIFIGTRFLIPGVLFSTYFISLWTSNASTTMMLVLAIELIRECSIVTSEIATPNQELDLTNTSERQLDVYKAIFLSILYGAAIGGSGTIIASGQNLIFYNYLNMVFPVADLTFGGFALFALPQAFIMLFICSLWLQLIFIGFSFDNMHENRIRDVLREMYARLGKVRYEEITVLASVVFLIVLWLTRRFWGNFFPSKFVSDGTAAVFVSLMLFVLPAENLFSVASREQIVSGSPVRTIMTWNIMKEKFPLSKLLLLGGGSAIITGTEQSGLSAWICNYLSEMQHLPPWLLVAITSAIVCVLAELFGNLATVSIFIPFVVSIAEAHHRNPLSYAITVCFASLFTFLFPADTPQNSIRFTALILTTSDLIISGCVIKISAFFVSQFSSLAFTALNLNNWNSTTDGGSS